MRRKAPLMLVGIRLQFQPSFLPSSVERLKASKQSYSVIVAAWGQCSAFTFHRTAYNLLPFIDNALPNVVDGILQLGRDLRETKQERTLRTFGDFQFFSGCNIFSINDLRRLMCASTLFP
jgi:hypothetical protein